jgi:type I restriction enzyme M protein
MDELFTEWKTRNTKLLKGLTIGVKPKQTIFKTSEDILKTYTGKALMDKYDVYQHLMNYWYEIMQDDCYLVAVDGWKAELSIIKETKSATVWDCDLVPKTLVIDRYFLKEKKTIEKLEADKEALATQITELEEEHSGEDGYFADMDKVNKANVQKRLKELATQKPKSKKRKEEYLMAAEPEVAYGILGEAALLEQYLKLLDNQTEINKKIKEATADLDKKVIERYKTLNETEIKQLVVDDKWMASIERSVKTEMERISQRLTQRIKELAERYETPLPKQTDEVATIEAKVNAHLKRMGFVWK